MINAINKFFANKSLKDIVSYLIYFLVFMMFPYIFDFYELLKGEDSDNEYRPRQPPTKKPIPKKQPVKKTPLCHECNPQDTTASCRAPARVHHYPTEILLQRDATSEIIIQHPFTHFQRISDDESVSDLDSDKSYVDSDDF